MSPRAPGSASPPAFGAAAPTPPGGGGLTRRVFSGGAWGLVGTFGQGLAAFAASLVIARRLTPSDFAVAAIAITVVNVAARLGDIGLLETIVKEREELPELCHTAFVALCGLGLVLAVALLALLPALISFYGEPRLLGALPVLTISLVLGLVAGVPTALLKRDLRLREVNLVSMGQRYVSALVGAGMAMLGLGFWALVVPGAVAQAAATPALFRFARYRPRPSFAWKRLRARLSFGAGVFAARLLSYFGDDLDYFVLGRALKKPDFGQYYFAFTRARFPYALLGSAIQGPLFPAFAEVQDDRPRLQRAVTRAGAVHFSVFGPLAMFLFLLADPLIPFLFGDQWRPSVPICRVFALMALLPAAGGFTGAVLLALGRSWLMVALNIVRLAAVAGALAWGVATHQSVFAISVAVAATTMAALAFHVVVLFRVLGLGLNVAWRMYGRPSLAIGAAALALVVTQLVGWRAETLPVVAYLAGAGIVLAGVYAGATWLVNRPVVDEVVPWVRDQVNRRWPA